MEMEKEMKLMKDQELAEIKQVPFEKQLSKLRAKMFKFLFEHEICIRCILRFNKNSYYSDYRWKDGFIELIRKVEEMGGMECQEIEGRYDSDKQKIRGTVNNCQICLGIMQQCDSQDNIESIRRKVEERQQEYDSFKFQIKVPLSVNIRMRCYVQKMKKELEQYKDDEEYKELLDNWRQQTVDCKLAIKWIVASRLSQELGVISNKNDRFVIMLEYVNEVDNELMFGLFINEVMQFQIKRIEDKREKKLKVNKAYDAPKLNSQIKHTQANLDMILGLDDECFERTVQLAQIIQRQNCGKQIELEHDSVLLMGRYTKYSRILSQTQWILDKQDKRIYETSIEEEMGKVLTKYCGTEKYKFHSGGREDIDVRMLNNGRPFVMEMVNPRKTKNIADDIVWLQQQINKSTLIQIDGLFETDNSCFGVLKQSEEHKVKGYCCVVHFHEGIDPKKVEAINELENIVIKQMTPLRVLHRRTLMVRDKLVHKVNVVPVNNSYGLVYVLASAGTYIKEFVHGDLERTLPNLGTYMGKADILQLDVVYLYDQVGPNTIQHFNSVSKLDPSIKL